MQTEHTENIHDAVTPEVLCLLGADKASVGSDLQKKISFARFENFYCDGTSSIL